MENAVLLRREFKKILHKCACPTDVMRIHNKFFAESTVIFVTTFDGAHKSQVTFHGWKGKGKSVLVHTTQAYWSRGSTHSSFRK